MKPVNPITILKTVFLAVSLASLSINVSYSQCASTTQSQTYNVLLNGTGNNNWGFVFPQFSPSKGTLVAVVISSLISVNENFQLKNTGSSPETFTVNSSRSDDISVSAMSSQITYSYSANEGPFTLAAGADTVGAGTNASPQYFALVSSHNIYDSITSAVADFLGTGYVVFTNNPITSASVTGGADYNIDPSYSDTMKISMTYYYCTASVLPELFTSFSVTKEDGPLAKLQWTTTNEKPGRTYIIEESGDGKDFDSVGIQASFVGNNGNSTYAYNYTLLPSQQGMLYFRLKEVNSDGNIDYSDIRTIDVSGPRSNYLYPNPATDHIQIVFGQQSIIGWELGIYSADGQLIQRNRISGSASTLINFRQKLSPGVYFTRSLNLDNNQVSVLEFVVR
jgi:hypothetical protein